MKLLLSFLLFLFGFSELQCQFGEKNAIYLSSEVNLGNYFGFDSSINYIYDNKYSMRFGYSVNVAKSSNQPSDYSSGLLGVFTLGLVNAYDQLENFHLDVGKIYPLNQSGTIRLNATVGLGYTLISVPTKWSSNGGSSFISSNYSWEYHNYSTISLTINPKIEFPIARVYGFSLSPMLQISKDKTYFGIGIGHTMGLLRGRIKKNNSNN